VNGKESVAAYEKNKVPQNNLPELPEAKQMIAYASKQSNRR
jgi:hypothetical protein